MLATQSSVVKGRWGWHAIDYPTFVAFKRLHKLAFRDFRATRRLRRWELKLPHNRVQKHKDGTETPIPKPECLGFEREEYDWILAEYRDVRRPAPTQEEVPTFSPPKKWRERLAELDEFYAE